MQLIIFTNAGTCSRFKVLNEELQLTSFRMLKCPYTNASFKQVCTVEIRGRYVKSKNIVDKDVLGCMQDQIERQLQRKIAADSVYHQCLHVYAHDGTLGVLFRGFVPMDKKKAVIRAPQLAELMRPYLTAHPECTSVKLHVCFSGCTYNNTQKPYGQLLAEELQNMMRDGVLSQNEMRVEASNGWSIIGTTSLQTTFDTNDNNDNNNNGAVTINHSNNSGNDDNSIPTVCSNNRGGNNNNNQTRRTKDRNDKNWKHFVVPRTDESLEMVEKDEDFQLLIDAGKYLPSREGKPRWTVTREEVTSHQNIV